MEKKVKTIYFLMLILIGIVIFQNVLLRSRIDNLNHNINNVSSQFFSVVGEIGSLRAVMDEMQMESRNSFGGNARILGAGKGNRLLMVEVAFSLRESEAGAQVFAAAVDEMGVSTEETARYSNGVYTAVLKLDAARTYSFIYYVSEGSGILSGEILPYYQPKNELLERMKISIGRFEDRSGFELYPYIVNLHNGSDMLIISSAKIEVIEQSPGTDKHEIDITDYLTDSGNTQHIGNEREGIRHASGDTLYAPERFKFDAPETSDYTVRIVLTDNIGYTYTYTETINRRPGSSSGSSGWLEIS